MMRIRTEPLPEITVSRLRRMRDVLDLDPPYQREGNVWKPETRSALIDSIVNGLDVPKLYFERVTTKRTGPKGLAFEYAAIDGKQRLEAILAFMDNKLALPDDFWFFENSDIDAAGLTLAELEGNEKYFELVRRFWDFELPIVVVDTDSGDLIEEMFQRLNASTALNAAERRNSVQGPTREAANRLAAHRLLVELSPIRSARYKYRELGAKFLAIEHQIDTRGKIADTKAATLYDLFVATRDPDPTIVQQEISAYEARAAATLDRMAQLFDENDPLLRSIGTVVVYYIAFRDQDFADAASRDALSDFETARRVAAAMAETHDTYSTVANARLREYNVWVQSTNDGTALARRAKILSRFVLGHQSGDAMAALETMTEGEVPKEDDSAD